MPGSTSYSFGEIRSLGRTSTLKTLERFLRLQEVRAALFKFCTVDLGALIETGVLNCPCGRNSERFGKS